MASGRRLAPLKLGGLLNASKFDQDVTNNREGVFTFNSLEELENDQPASFSRTLAPAIRSGSALNPAVYLGDTWRKSSALQLNYGVRLEASSYGGAPPENTLVDSAFGLRTNHFPSEVHSESARRLHMDDRPERSRRADDDRARWCGRVPEPHAFIAVLGGRGCDGCGGIGVAARVHW